jgi:hypothetical protein
LIKNGKIESKLCCKRNENKKQNKNKKGGWGGAENLFTSKMPVEPVWSFCEVRQQFPTATSNLKAKT